MVILALRGGLQLRLARHVVIVTPGRWANTIPPLAFVIMDTTEMVLRKFLVRHAQREATVTETVTHSAIVKQTTIPKQDTPLPVWERAEHVQHIAIQTVLLIALFAIVKHIHITLSITVIFITMNRVTRNQILAIYVLCKAADKTLLDNHLVTATVAIGYNLALEIP